MFVFLTGFHEGGVWSPLHSQHLTKYLPNASCSISICWITNKQTILLPKKSCLNNQYVLSFSQNCPRDSPTSSSVLTASKSACSYLIRLQNSRMKCSWPGMKQQVSIRANGISWGIFPSLKPLPIDEVVCLKVQNEWIQGYIGQKFLLRGCR